jgi:hypothetical protein
MSNKQMKKYFLSKLKHEYIRCKTILLRVLIRASVSLSKFDRASQRLKVALLSSSAIAVIALILLIINHHHKNKNEQSRQLNAAMYSQVSKASEDLSIIGVQVASLTESLNNEHSVVEFDVIRKSLDKMSRQIQEMKDKNDDSLTLLIQVQGDKTNQKLDSLQAGIDALQINENKVIYLHEQELPFLLESVDLIQQQQVVTVRYDYKSQPLDVGYSLAGWELISADFSKQRAEFRNHKQQHIIINLTQRGSMA